MDSDRRSAVSSFYGGRRSSVDALNKDYAPPSLSDHRARRDSSSSFFNPNATGNLPSGAAGPARVHGAGYNRMSYLDAGREEPVKGGNDEFERPNEGGWDVYADFMGCLCGLQQRRTPLQPCIWSRSKRTGVCETLVYHSQYLAYIRESYQQIPSPHPARVEEDSSKGPVELVTVPALGAEWGKTELKAMTKKGRKEQDSEGFGRKWKAFNRGQYGLFGRKWLTRRTVVFIAFAVCAMYVFFLPIFVHDAYSLHPSLPSVASESPLPLSFHAYLTLPSEGRLPSHPPRAGLTSPSRHNSAALPPTSPSRRIYSSRSTPTRTSCRSFLSTWMRRCTALIPSMFSLLVT